MEEAGAYWEELGLVYWSPESKWKGYTRVMLSVVRDANSTKRASQLPLGGKPQPLLNLQTKTMQL